MARELVEELVLDAMERASRPNPRPLPGRAVAGRSERGRYHGNHAVAAQQSRPKSGGGYAENGYGSRWRQESGYDSDPYYTAPSAPPKLTHRQVARSVTDPCLPATRESEDKGHNGVVLNMKQKLTHNIEHYSNLFQEITFPILFRRSGRNQRSRSNSASRGDTKHSNNNNNRDQSPCIISERSEEDYPAIENIELYQFDGFVFGSERETGKGHSFQPIQLKAPTWCDRCGEFIWGVYKQCLRCQNCQYTCHHPCRKAITLDCASVQSEIKGGERPLRSNQSETSLSEKPQALICNESTVWYFKRTPSRRRFLFTKLKGILNHVNPWSNAADVIYEDDTDSGYHTGDGSLGEEARRYRGLVLPPKPPGEYTLTREDLRNRIEAFNNNNQGLIMSLHQESNTFQGFIRVHINLIRPINMSLAVRPPSLYEVLTHEEEHPPQTPPTPTDGDTQIASFYLPKDTTKVIHISSDTTTQEVIKLLLSKFKITDNPRKFALYEKLEHENVMRKMSADEQPLPLCLTWGSDGLTTHKFVLQENDSGDVIWEAFSVPELRNFLAILNKEEEEYVDQIKAKYSLMQIHITRRMQEIQKEIQKGRAKSALSSALTQKMSQTSVSAPETPERQSDSKHRLGVGKVRKSDVHKDTPRPFEIPSPGQGQVGEGQRGDLDVDRLQGQLQANQHRPAKEKSPPSVAFGEDEREGVFV